MRKCRWRNLAGSLCGCLLIGLVGAAGLAPGAAHGAPTPDQVDASIERGVAFLRSQQQKDGSWEMSPRPAAGAAVPPAWGGDTAVATCALLDVGIRSGDPEMIQAVRWLAHEDLHGTYAVGLRSRVWWLIGEHSRNKDKDLIAARDHDCEFMLHSCQKQGPDAGFYGEAYGESRPGAAPGFAPIDPKGPPMNAPVDRFNSQFAMDGMWALEHAGAEVPTQYWIDERAAWKKAQRPDGGWDLGGAGAQSGSVYTATCAGVCALFMTQDYILRFNYHQFEKCSGGPTGKEIEMGLAWLGQNVAQAFDPRQPPNMYGLYEIARAGDASGHKYLGDIDWYKSGAERIVATQHADGSWGSIADTSFALLFLSRGRVPLMFNKLQYDLPNAANPHQWNQRPRDVANLANWTGPHALCGWLSWQTLSLSAPSDGMHDASVLYISGSEALEFNQKDLAKLRAFVEEGGLILGNADCLAPEFIASFMKLGKTLFPQYDFRKLPPDHLIFDEQYHAKKWKRVPELQSMSNGVREIMIISPNTDMGRAWQIESIKTREECFLLADNIFLYATGEENLVHRGGNHHIVRPQGPAGREIKVARIRTVGNWDPEPAGWRRLSAILHNDRQIDVKPEPVALGEGKLIGYKIAALTGTTALHLDPAQCLELKQFVDNGGTLIVDSAGGGAEFADSAEAMLKQTFGDAAAKQLQNPLSLPLAHAFYADLKLERVNYRNYARRMLDGDWHLPRRRGISTPAGRIGVFFSREDLTAGLVGQAVDGIIGYRPDDATQLVAGMILYADKNRLAGRPCH